jgi:hypothetical protein
LDDLPIMSVAGGIGSAYASTDLLPGASHVQAGFGTLRVNGAPASLANRVPGEPLFTQDLNRGFDPRTTFVLNPNAWEDPAPGQFGTGPAYYNDYRYGRVPSENMSFGRVFRFGEGMSAQVRIEFTNIFNRNRIPNPTADNALATQQRNADGTTRAGFGYINALAAGGQRSGQMVIRFNF